jgi:hypothetical protein
MTTYNSVASNQTGNLACLKPHTRFKVVKKKKEQTLMPMLMNKARYCLMSLGSPFDLDPPLPFFYKN